MSREELLQLYVMKLDEEANYFKATSPVEEEFCNCPKCQVGTRCTNFSLRACVNLALAVGDVNHATCQREMCSQQPRAYGFRSLFGATTSAL